MEDFSLLIDLHKGSKRQGPGGEMETSKALELAELPRRDRLRVLDIGCGTGASALQLARCLDADVTAVDLSAEFIDILAENAEAAGLGEKVKPLVASMSVSPELIRPRSSACLIMLYAGLSLTDPAGLFPSSFTSKVLEVFPGRRCKRTRGVLPMKWDKVWYSVITSGHHRFIQWSIALCIFIGRHYWLLHKRL